jgi:predicted site-specific integrase-resolvase
MRKTSKSEFSELLKPAEAAEILGVQVRTLALWASLGRIESFKLPSGHRRYYADEIYDLRGNA